MQRTFQRTEVFFFLISFCKGTLIKIGWWIIWCVQETDSFNLSKLSRPIKYSKNCKNQTTNLCCSFPDCVVLCPPSVQSTIVASSGAEWVKKNTHTHKTTHRLFRLVQVIQWTTQEEKKNTSHPPVRPGQMIPPLFSFSEVSWSVFWGFSPPE